MPPMTAPTPLSFGPFTLDIAAARLCRGDQDIALRPKAYDLLLALVRRPGELMTKDELLDVVWHRRFISEGVVKTAICELRQALGDDPRQPRWIVTVARRGYRFGNIAAVADQAPVPAPSAAEAPATPPAAPPARWPARLSPVLGRQVELARLGQLLAAHRLVTVAGPSGVGKTSLAQAFAADPAFAGTEGGWFVELAPLAAAHTDETALCVLIARSLQLGTGAGQGADALGRALARLAWLVVVDNAEHLLGTLAPLLATLMVRAPGLRLLVTSQEPLHLPGEQVYRLEPLSLPAADDHADADRLMASGAVRLFIERVGERLPGFALAPAQQRAVVDICRALDGLPLAVELAAARVPVLGVHGIADLLLSGDLHGRMRLLGQEGRSARGHQRSLHDALAWSHGLLDDRQRRVFRRLGVFHGGFTLAAAQAMFAHDEALDPWGVVDAVQALVDKSLLSAPPGQDGAPRFALLESLRAFALERLAEAGETEATLARHAAVVAEGWLAADERALDTPSLAWLATQLPELDNLRAALRWAAADPARADTGLALFGRAAMVWPRAGLATEGRSWAESWRTHAQATAEPALRRGFDTAVAVLAMYAQAYPSGPAAVEALRLAEEHDAAGDARRAYFASYLAYQLGVQAQSGVDRPALLQRLQSFEQPQWTPMRLRFGRNARGYEHRLAGRASDYLAFCRSEFALCRALGAVGETWVAGHGLMLAEHDNGHRLQAMAVGRLTLSEIRAAGRLQQHGPLLALWATMLAESGDGPGTRTALAETLPVLHSAGSVWMAHLALAWLAHGEGRAEAAARLLGWQEAHERSQPRLASGGYIAQTRAELRACLDARLGPAACKRQVLAGADLGDNAAEALALAGGDPCHAQGVRTKKSGGTLAKRSR